LLALAASWAGHPQIRARGTLGGSLAFAHPAAELPAAAVALNATLVLEGPGGRRQVSAEEFFGAERNQTRTSNEVLVHSLWPVAARSRRVSMMEMRHGHGAPSALVGVAAMREDGAKLTASVFGAKGKPTRLRALESEYTPRMDAADMREMVAGVVAQLPDLADEALDRRSYRARVLEALLVQSLQELGSQRARPNFPRVKPEVTS
jgi:carbon-monoxide dehydrogenase medium subunit